MNSKPASGEPAPNAGEVRLELDVYGMRCQGCATNLRLGLGELDGVRQVEVDLPGNRVAVVGQADVLQEATVRAKVAELGYRLTPRKSLFQRLKPPEPAETEVQPCRQMREWRRSRKLVF